jgi:hypothetical protein
MARAGWLFIQLAVFHRTTFAESPYAYDTGAHCSSKSNDCSSQQEKMSSRILSEDDVNDHTALLQLHKPVVDKSAVKPASADTAISDEESLFMDQLGSRADKPSQINKYDLHGIRDLLLVGYYGTMTLGPHLKYQAQFCGETKVWGQKTDEADFPGLQQLQQGVVDFAKLLPQVHPVKECRESMKTIAAAYSQASLTIKQGEEFVMKMADEAWKCIGVTKEWFITEVKGVGGVVTNIRAANGSRITYGFEDWGLDSTEYMDSWMNYFLAEGLQDKMGACKSGHSMWLRPCSYWSAFHTMGMRADALGGDLPGRLFAGIAKIIAGGALFCGG